MDDGRVPPLENLAGYDKEVPERFVPGLMHGLIEAEHFARYWWATQFVRGRAVLDAGCGLAYGASALAEAGADEVVGVDLAEEVLEAARSHVHPRVHLERGDVRALPFPDARFDVVVCFEVIEHLERPGEALAEFARVLVPNGLLVVSSPNRAVFPGGNPHHVHEFLPDELHDALVAEFGRVRLFRQHPWLVSAVMSDRELAAGQGAPIRLATRKIESHAPRTALYTLALASNAPLPTPRALGAVISTDETRRWLERLEELQSAVTDRERELANLRAAQALSLEQIANAERIRAEHAERLAALERTLAEESRTRVETERARVETERARAAEARRLAEAEHQLALRTADVQRIAAERDAAQRYVNLMQETVSWRITAPLRSVRRTLRRSANRASAPAARDAAPKPDIAPPASPAPARDAIKAVLFVTLGGPVARRYRCDHQSEELQLSGVTTDVVEHGEVDLDDALERYQAFILHRVPFGPDIDRFLRRARSLGKPVIFDTDDLVFEPALIRYVAALDRLGREERDLFVEGVHRYRETLVRCDAVVASTEPLAEHVGKLHRRVVVAPNAASVEMVERADQLLAGRRETETSRDTVTLAYLSGTATHDRDFREATDAVLQVLEKRPHTRFLAVGPLALDSRFDLFAGRVETLPLQPWDRLPDLIMKIDVNLAPLERDNPFTEAKSCIKYIEAGLFEVPTVASPRADFVRAIEDGRNGLLADAPAEWERSITRLVDDRDVRRRIGREAASDIRRRHTVKGVSRRYHRTIADLVSAGDQAQPLEINWVMYPPFARAGGGERNIFRIQEQLAQNGHRQRVYINPIEHFRDFSHGDAIDFLEEAFGGLNAEVTLGYDDIAAADVTIGTFWPTAYVVAAHDKSLFKAYFVQDYEPEFYEPDDPRRLEAEETYRLPLRHICLGRHLAGRVTSATDLRADFVDFALDDAFQLRTPPEQRGGRTRILFYARPSLPRRGYELGVDALRRAKQARPDAEIAFFGSNTEDLGELPFEFENLGVLDTEALASAMNEAHVLLSISFTNISNVPFEGMACGCAVVDVDLPNVSSMVAPDTCVLARPSPEELASALVRLVDDPELRVRVGSRGAAEMQGRRWERTGAQFEQALLDLCFARIRDRRGAHVARPAAAAVRSA